MHMVMQQQASLPASLSKRLTAAVQGRKWWRIGEPLVLISIFVTLGMLLPLAFPCTPTECYIKQGDTAPYCPEGTSTSIKWVMHTCIDWGNLGPSLIRFQQMLPCTQR